MKILIIEDEKFGFENLCRVLRQIDTDIEIDGPITNVVDFKKTIHSPQNYDIIFSDIRLEDGLCFEALTENSGITTPIIFVTAYDEYAINAFKLGGVGYILKPIDRVELKNAIQRAVQMKCGSQNMDILLQAYNLPTKVRYPSKLLIKNYDGMSILQVSEISCISFEDGKVVVYMTNGYRHLLSERSLDKVITRLNPMCFFRANRQYVIHINAIKRIHIGFRQTEIIELFQPSDLRVTVSKERVAELHNWIEHT